jgi:[NiFe] hydrogenase assembly HybE family chaperone
MTEALLPDAAARPAAAAGIDAFGDPSARLQAAFDTIARTRMDGVPILNDALRVQSVGFRRWNGFWLGVLVTPWCMNLMLLPAVPALWPRRRIGEKLKYVFPAGVFEFIAGREKLLADGVQPPAGTEAAAEAASEAAAAAASLRDAYLMCSLFSPVFEFADHEAAVATGAACLDALFDDANYEATEMAVTRAPVTISADAAAAAAAADAAEAAADAAAQPSTAAGKAAASAGAPASEAGASAAATAEATDDAPTEAPAAAAAASTPAADGAYAAAPASPTKRDFLRGRWSPR